MDSSDQTTKREQCPSASPYLPYPLIPLVFLPSKSPFGLIVKLGHHVLTGPRLVGRVCGESLFTSCDYREIRTGLDALQGELDEVFHLPAASEGEPGVVIFDADPRLKDGPDWSIPLRYFGDALAVLLVNNAVLGPLSLGAARWRLHRWRWRP